MGQWLQFAKRHLWRMGLIFLASCAYVVGVLMNAQQIATEVLPGWGWQLVGAALFLLSVLSILSHWDKEYVAQQGLRPNGAQSDESRFDGRKQLFAEGEGEEFSRLPSADQAVRRFRSELRVLVLSNGEDLMQSYLKCYRTVRDLSRQKEAVAPQASFSTGFAEMAISTGLQPQFQRVTELAQAQTDAADHAR